MAWIADVVKNRNSARVASVIDDEVAKSENTLRDACGDGYILDLAEWNVASGSRNQAGVDFNFGIRQGVANHVSTQMAVSGDKQ